MKRCFLLLITVALLLLPGIAWTGSAKANPEKAGEGSTVPSPVRPGDVRQNRLSLPGYSHPLGLAYLLENREFHLNHHLLLLGSRAGHDRARNGPPVLGHKQTDRDWILEQGTTAVWVTGVPAPGLQEQIVLRASLEEGGDGSLTLRGHQVMRIGREGERTMTLRKGEYVYYALPGARSVTCPVELSGDSVEIAHYDPFSGIILEAVKPGVTKMRVYTLFRLDTQRRFHGEHEVVVD